MAAVHQVVIIGASFGGLPVAHELLKTAQLKNGKLIRVVLVNPTNEFVFKISLPRVVANPSSIPLDKALLDFLPHFKQYGSDRFEFIQAHARSIDSKSKTVTLSNSAKVRYDSLVLASGTSFSSDLWSTTPGSQKLRSAVKNVHDRVASAQTILIAGGGPVGVETTGEFGELYGGKKNITLLSGTKGLLYHLDRKDVGQDAQKMLEKQGVKVIHDSIKVAQAEKDGDKYVLTLSNGEIKTVDLYIDATGDKPNSQYVPVEWLNDKKMVKVDHQTLRLNVPGVKGVYAIGSVASYSTGGIMDVKGGLKPLLESIRLDLSGAEPGSRTNNIYKPFQKQGQMVPVGSTQGVGTAFGWKFPSFVVKMIKSKDFFIGNAQKAVQGQI